MDEAISTPDLGLFFAYLIDTKNRAYSTITGYRTSIHSVLKHYQNNACFDPVISQMLQAVKTAQPQEPEKAPKWDLRLVLNIPSRLSF